jgi:hypothetical protein
MRRAATALICVTAIAVVFAGLGSGTATAGNKKLVEGIVLDGTCGVSCLPPCPPPCGPIPAPQSRGDVICARASIVCPLTQKQRTVAPDFCIQGEPCGVVDPIYSGEGSLVNVRKRGSTEVIARLPIVEGHFKIRLAPGNYVFHPYMAEEQCWSAEPATTKVAADLRGAVTVRIYAHNSCAIHTE